MAVVSLERFLPSESGDSGKVAVGKPNTRHREE